MLAATIDGELRYGLGVAEEGELLFGSGSGQHILGIVPQATAYETARNSTGDTAFDTLAHAIAQAETALLPASGIVMNNDDLEQLKVIKDDEGRYIGGGPFGSADYDDLGPTRRRYRRDDVGSFSGRGLLRWRPDIRSPGCRSDGFFRGS